MCSVNLSTSKHPSSLSPRSSPPPAWYEGYSFSCLSNLLPHPRARGQHQDAYQVHPNPKSGRQNPPRQVVQQLRGRGEAKAHRRGSRPRHGYVRFQVILSVSCATLGRSTQFGIENEVFEMQHEFFYFSPRRQAHELCGVPQLQDHLPPLRGPLLLHMCRRS